MTRLFTYIGLVMVTAPVMFVSMLCGMSVFALLVGPALGGMAMADFVDYGGRIGRLFDVLAFVFGFCAVIAVAFFGMIATDFAESVAESILDGDKFTDHCFAALVGEMFILFSLLYIFVF